MLRVCLVATILLVGGCGQPPTSPTQPSAFTVKDGRTGLPVSGANVSAPGQAGVTDSAGRITLVRLPVYFVDAIHVRSDLVNRRDIALRALLGALVLGPHPLEGLLNATHPVNELSPFERKTIHMLGLRWGKEGHLAGL